MEKEYSKIASIPQGRANQKIITPGCLVLEGGAFRSLYTQGVLDYFMQADLNIQTVIGVSAGALSGINYVSGQIGRTARCTLGHRHNKRYVGFRNIFFHGGVVNYGFIFGTFDALEPMDKKQVMDPHRLFIAEATNMLTGQGEFFSNQNSSYPILEKACQASGSMPFLSHKVMINGVPYLDGGCAVKVPFRWALDQNFGKVIVIRTRHPDFRKKINRKATDHQTERRYFRYPNFVHALEETSDNYNRDCDEMIELHKAGQIYMLAPSKPVTIQRLESDLNVLGDLYWLGYNDAKNHIDEIKTSLK